MQDLGADAVAGRKQRTAALPRAMIRNCRKALFRWKSPTRPAWSSPAASCWRHARPAAAAAAACARRRTTNTSASCCRRRSAACIANAALSMAGRVTANLNYTATPDVLNACLRRAGIRRVLTSRKVMENPVFEKFKDTLDAEFVYLGRPARQGAARRQAGWRRSMRFWCRRWCSTACSACTASAATMW